MRRAGSGCISPSAAAFFTPATGRRNPILYAYDPPAKTAAIALIDCSYGNYEKPLGECWSALEPFAERGPLLLPVPANGRGPEIALEFLRYGRTDIYVDDAMDRALRQLCTAPTTSFGARRKSSDDMKALAVTAKPIETARGMMLAASADGTSGATKQLLEQWAHNAEPAIVFTGYRAPDTPADRLIKSGRAQFLRWNVHPRFSDVVALVRHIRRRRHPRILRSLAASRSRASPRSRAGDHGRGR